MVLSDGPALVIVNGPSDAAKSSLARVLAERLGIPHLARDGIRDELYAATSPLTRTAEGVQRKLSAQAGEQLMAEAARGLSAGQPVLVEGPLQPRIDDARIARLRRELGVRPLQILVTAALPVLVRRREEHDVRQRGQAPRAPAALRDLERTMRDDSRPLDGLTTIRVDTTSFEQVDIDELETRIRAWMLSGDGVTGGVRRD
jgi:predicted kinase